jgi:hypothetical protein
MKQPYRHRVNHREFLNLPGFHEGAYVMAYVEDTSERGLQRYEDGGHLYNPEPRMLLQIADCERHINLEFEISTPHRRMNSFHKVQVLIDALEAFKAGGCGKAQCSPEWIGFADGSQAAAEREEAATT